MIALIQQHFQIDDAIEMGGERRLEGVSKGPFTSKARGGQNVLNSPCTKHIGYYNVQTVYPLIAIVNNIGIHPPGKSSVLFYKRREVCKQPHVDLLQMVHSDADRMYAPQYNEKLFDEYRQTVSCHAFGYW